MKNKVLEVQRLIDQKPTEESYTIDISEAERKSGVVMGSGSFCVPCEFSDPKQNMVCRSGH